MMLPSDMALLWDKTYRTHVEAFAANEDVFLGEFAKAFGKLMELGVPAFKKPFYQFW